MNKSVFLMDKELITFLKRNRAYSKFMRNLKYGKIEDLNDAVILAAGAGVDSTPITAAFVWSKTPEGYNFWDALNAKYENNITCKE